MTLSDFIENLAKLNVNENFPKELLKTCYLSIKQKELVWAEYVFK